MAEVPATTQFSFAEELASIASRAQTYTSASGAAIALSEGQANEIVCCASSGPAAPDVGAHLRLEGTFTGQCVRTSQALRCDDSETDKRVDAAACRALNTRSIVVVPVMEESAVIGVLAAFSGNRTAFTELHVAVLRTMAREIAVAVQKARQPDGKFPPIQYRAVPVRASAPAAAPSLGSTNAGMFQAAPGSVPAPAPAPKPSPVAAVPAPAQPSPGTAPTLVASAPAAAKIEAPLAPPKTIAVPKPQVAAPPAPKSAEAAAPPLWKPAPPPPVRKPEPVTQRPSPPMAKSAPEPVSFGAASGFSTFERVAAPEKKGGPGMMLIGGGMAALLVLGGGGWFAYSQFNRPASPQPAAQQSAPAPATLGPSANETSGSPTASVPGATAAPASSTAAIQPPAVTPSTPSSTSAAAQKLAARAANAAPVPAQTLPPPKPSPAQASAPTQAVVERATSTQTAPARQEEAPQPVVSAPAQMNVPLSAAPNVAVAAAPPVRVSQSTPAQLLTSVAPKYPEIARSMRASGNVVLQVTVGKDGAVKAVKVVSGHALLREAASSAVRQWRYRPATLNGQPTDTTLDVTVRFAAPQ